MHKQTTDTRMLTKFEEDNTQKTTNQMMHVYGRDNGTDMRRYNNTEDANNVLRGYVYFCSNACLFLCCHTKLRLWRMNDSVVYSVAFKTEDDVMFFHYIKEFWRIIWVFNRIDFFIIKVFYIIPYDLLGMYILKWFLQYNILYLITFIILW